MCAFAVCPYTANVLAHIKAARQPLVARVTTDVQREVNQQMCSVRFNKGLDIMKEPVSAYSSPAFELEKAVGSEYARPLILVHVKPVDMATQHFGSRALVVQYGQVQWGPPLQCSLKSANGC